MRSARLLAASLALAVVALLAGPALAADTEGKIKSVDFGKRTFVMTDVNGHDWTFKEGDNVQIRCNDKACALSDLKEGDKVLITYAKSGRDLIASDIKATRSSASAEAADATSGTIKKIDTNHNQVTLTDKNNREWTFDMADGATVEINNRPSKFVDLKVGEEVTVKYQKRGKEFLATDIKAAKK
jgi:Cu/Ag efflux protein CusF